MNYEALALEALIHERLTVRAMYRKHGWAGFPMTPAATELRVLFAVRRLARDLAKPDPIDAAMSYHDWQATETRVRWQPARLPEFVVDPVTALMADESW